MFVSAAEQEWGDSGSAEASQEASDHDPADVGLEQENEETSEGDAGAFMNEFAQTLTVTSTKPKP